MPWLGSAPLLFRARDGLGVLMKAGGPKKAHGGYARRERNGEVHSAPRLRFTTLGVNGRARSTARLDSVSLRSA